ncbi:MAG: biotin/lipoyl-containing protein [Vicinamibacterales bacterium]
MIFEIELNGRSRTVALERDTAADGRFRITIDGETTTVDAKREGASGVSLLLPRQPYTGAVVQFAPGTSPGEQLGLIDGRTLTVVVNGRRSGHGGADSGGTAHGEQRITAPMPGRVVRVLVSVGDTVEARQPVVVVEAMKMENELRSPKAGRVTDVVVVPGTSVEAGRVLVVVE